MAQLGTQFNFMSLSRQRHASHLMIIRLLSKHKISNDPAKLCNQIFMHSGSPHIGALGLDALGTPIQKSDSRENKVLFSPAVTKI